MPTRSARDRTGTTNIRDANKAMKNASRPAAMRQAPKDSRMAAPPGENTILLFLLRFNRLPPKGYETPGDRGRSSQIGDKFRIECSCVSPIPVSPPALSFGEHPAEDALHFFLVLGRVIPVDGPLQPLAERDFWLPAEQFLRQGIVRHAVQRTRGHVRTQLDLGLVSGKFAKHTGAN